MKKRPTSDPLTHLIDAADRAVLGELVRQLASARPEARRTCLAFLKGRVASRAEAKAKAEAQAALSLWDMLEPDLAELDEYGGGSYETQDYVGGLLYDLQNTLKKVNIPWEDRRALLDDVVAYICSANSGMEDALYDVAYAACRKEAEWRYLAQCLEALEQDWTRGQARRIYRRIGDVEKYLELRKNDLENGTDYHDLATFYWERGEREQALAAGREGLEKAKGRMDELRGFMAERAKQAGDRQGYLELQFMQAVDWLTLEKYRVFKNCCTAREWRVYEPRILEALGKSQKVEQIEIRMYRKEHKEAMAVLSKMHYPGECMFGDTRVLKVAERIEKAFPEEMLAFYLARLGTLNDTCTRTNYAHKAGVAKKSASYVGGYSECRRQVGSLRQEAQERQCAAARLSRGIRQGGARLA